REEPPAAAAAMPGPTVVRLDRHVFVRQAGPVEKPLSGVSRQLLGRTAQHARTALDKALWRGRQDRQHLAGPRHGPHRRAARRGLLNGGGPLQRLPLPLRRAAYSADAGWDSPRSLRSVEIKTSARAMARTAPSRPTLWMFVAQDRRASRSWPLAELFVLMKSRGMDSSPPVMAVRTYSCTPTSWPTGACWSARATRAGSAWSRATAGAGRSTCESSTTSRRIPGWPTRLITRGHAASATQWTSRLPTTNYSRFSRNANSSSKLPSCS